MGLRRPSLQAPHHGFVRCDTDHTRLNYGVPAHTLRPMNRWGHSQTRAATWLLALTILVSACAVDPPHESDPTSDAATLASTMAGDGTTCVGDAVLYRATYPADWFVHPVDAGLGVAECSQFGPQPFEFDPSDVPGGGGSVWLRAFSRGCFEYDQSTVVDTVHQVEVADLPAYRVESRIGGRVRDYTYVVNLNAPEPVLLHPGFGLPEDADCSNAAGLVLGTQEGVPGDFDANRAVVDAMAATLERPGSE